MQKRVLCTIAVGDKYKKILEATRPTHEQYAEKCGMNYFVISEETPSPHFLKWKINNLFKDYEQVTYVDCDVLIHPNAPDMNVPLGTFAAVNEGLFVPRAGLTNQYADANNFEQVPYSKTYFNTGVMVFDLMTSPLYGLAPLVETAVDSFYDQTPINYILQKDKIPTFSLQKQFNWMSCMMGPMDMRTHGWFIHYAGNTQLPEEVLLEMIYEDRQTLYPQFKKLKRKIAFKIDGGLGDQFAAEPAVRYAVENIFKTDDCIVITDHPVLFEHLSVPVYRAGHAKIENPEQYKLLLSLPPVNAPLWQHMSHIMVNAYDYAAVSLLKGQLPWKDRLPQLSDRFDLNIKSNQEGPLYRSLVEKINPMPNKAIAVHAGRGWPSKTFPADVWNSYLEVIKETHTPILIGKNINDEQGVVEGLNKDGCIDLVDKLSLEELIALLSCTDLLTNDSAPLHLAAPFDKHIGVIATCKRPEFIVPYRYDAVNKHVSLEYKKTTAIEMLDPKVESLYDKISRDPLSTGLITVDKCTDEELRKSLPSPDAIRKWIEFVLA